jgi:hypothetical protein
MPLLILAATLQISFENSELARITPPFNLIPGHGVHFSDDGRTVTYVVAKEGKEYVCVNGAPSQAWDRVDYGVPSQERSAVVYVAAKGGVTYVAANGKSAALPSFKFFDRIQGRITFDPTGTKVAFGAGRWSGENSSEVEFVWRVLDYGPIK